MTGVSVDNSGTKTYPDTAVGGYTEGSLAGSNGERNIYNFVVTIFNLDAVRGYAYRFAVRDSPQRVSVLLAFAFMFVFLI